MGGVWVNYIPHPTRIVTLPGVGFHNLWRLFLYDECACDEVAEELGDVPQEHLYLLSLLLRVAVTEPGVQTLEGVHLLPHLPNDLCKARAPNLKGKVNCLFYKVDNSKNVTSQRELERTLDCFASP